ncbi:DNA-binding protein, partial [Paenibacillus larvae]|nr:DNA-binding protein [Paenibacillus larvae]
MDNRIALRVELEKAIAETGCTLSSLAEYGGLSIGNLSASLQHKGKLRPITMKQLDTLTEALGLPEGHYYEYYLAEVSHNNKVSIPRMKSFLIRCAELGKTDLIMNAIHMLVEHPKYTELLFSVAEELYLNG